MLLSSMQQLLHAQHPWDFVINLSESDFPVKTTDQLVTFLTANRGRNFVKSHGREVQRFIQKQGLDKTFVECDTHMWRIGDRQLPQGIQIDGGSDWVALSRDFVHFVTNESLSSSSPLVVGLLRIFNHTLLPAESFFHTTIRNSHFCQTYVDNNLHVTNWKRRLGCKCQYKHVVDWCGCSPNDFKPDDWTRLLATEAKQVFFARKFEAIINQKIIEKLESWLFGAESESHPNQLHRHHHDPNYRSYWQSVYHADDLAVVDSSMLTVAKSIVRLAVAEQPEHFAGAYELYEALAEITTYMDMDLYRGLLVRAVVHRSDAQVMALEIWARPEQQPQASRSLTIGRRITHLEVSTDFDQKEQVSRNLAKILGIHSEPLLVLHLSGSAAVAAAGSISSTTPAPVAIYNVTILWINPSGRLADVTEMRIEEVPAPATGIYFSKSSLKLPLMPGIWTAKIIHRKGVVGKCDFLIVPNVPDVHVDEYGSANLYDGSTAGWNGFLPSPGEVARLTADMAANANRTGTDRLKWIDAMVKRFYVIKDICIVAAERNEFERSFQLCSNTSWSSMAPDPKSDIYSDLSLG